jgi:hypothetical protein
LEKPPKTLVKTHIFMLEGPFTAEDLEDVLACALKARADGTKARLVAFEYLRGSKGYTTVPEAVETSNCAKSAIYDAACIVEETLKRKRAEREKARKYSLPVVVTTLSRNRLPSDSALAHNPRVAEIESAVRNN